MIFSPRVSIPGIESGGRRGGGGERRNSEKISAGGADDALMQMSRAARQRDKGHRLKFLPEGVDSISKNLGSGGAG